MSKILPAVVLGALPALAFSSLVSAESAERAVLKGSASGAVVTASRAAAFGIIGTGFQQQKPAGIIGTGFQQQKPAGIIGTGFQQQKPAGIIGTGFQQQKPAGIIGTGFQQKKPGG
jgi:hypothetical protein